MVTKQELTDAVEEHFDDYKSNMWGLRVLWRMQADIKCVTVLSQTVHVLSSLTSTSD